MSAKLDTKIGTYRSEFGGLRIIQGSAHGGARLRLILLTFCCSCRGLARVAKHRQGSRFAAMALEDRNKR